MDREKLIRTLGYLLINSQTALMELQQEEKQPQQLPKPTHYTVIDGGDWIEWNDYKPWQHPYIRKHNHTKAHAIKFDNGAIFDMVNGWRKFEPEKEDQDHCHGPDDTWCNVCVLGVMKSERLVPRYPVKDAVGVDLNLGADTYVCACCNEKFQRFADYSAHNCYGHPTQKASDDKRVVPRALLEAILKMLEAMGPKTMPYSLPLVINDIKQALATEKSELKAP